MYRHEDNTITTDNTQLDSNVLGGIGTIFFNQMKRNGDKIAQIDTLTGERDTFTSLLQKSIRMGLVLQRKGVKRGDIIIYYSGIHLNAAVPVIASFFIGAVPAFLDVLLPAKEIAHLLKLVTPKLLLTDEKYFKRLEDIIETAGVSIDITTVNEDYFKHQNEEEEFIPVYVNDLNELVAIYFSSGSTGLPKGICLNHYRLLTVGVANDELYWKNGQDKIMLSYDSFYWTTELGRLCVSVQIGACRLVSLEKCDHKKIWYTLDKYKVNMVDILPFDVVQMCMTGKPSDVNLDSLLTLNIEGSLLPKQYELKIREILPNTDIFQPYGMTEVGLLLAFTKSDLHRAYSKRKIGSVGVPLAGSGISYKIVDLKSGRNLGPNNEGHLLVKGKNVMLGYYNLDSSEEFDEAGWFKTGDLAYYDEDLCFFITGRIKEMIKWQGWHVTPGFVEAELLAHPAVVRAVVVGIPDTVDGEKPLGLVVLRDNVNNITTKEIERFMEGRLSDRPLEVRIVNDVPTTPTGKIKRREIKKLVLRGDI